MAISVLLKIYLLYALTCVSRISFTCASFTSSTPSLQSTDIGSKATKGLSTENTYAKGVLLENTTIEANTTNNSDRKPQQGIIDSTLQTRKRSAKSLLSPEFTMDKFIAFMTASNNLMNSHTNYPRLDKLTKSFSSLYNSDGSVAVLNFWNMWVNVWTVVDAVANIFRAYETRILNTIDENQPQPPSPLEDLQQSLDDANNNIAVVSDLFQQLERVGEFEDGSAEQREDDHDESQVVQTIKRRSLQGVSQDQNPDGNEKNNEYDNDYHEVHGEEDQVHSTEPKINIRHKTEQHLAMETGHHFYNPVRYSSDSSDNTENQRSLAEADDYSNPITPSRRAKSIKVDIKSCKRKANQKSLISEQASEPTRKHSANISLDRTSVNVKHNGVISKRSNLRFNFGVDKFIYFMAKANNVLNSNTNNVQLNRFTRAFNDLFDSDGLSAFNTFYTLLASFWTIVDAVANVFRFNEARIRDQIQQQQQAAQPDPLEDLQAELDGTNANLAEVAELVSALQNGAGARVDSTNAKANNGPNRHHVPHKKKKHHSRPIHKGNTRRVHATPSPHQAIPSVGNHKIYKSHSTNTSKSITFSPVTTDPYSHFASGGWKPVTNSPQPNVETNRDFYNPVSYGNSQFGNRQHNPQSMPTINPVYNPVSRGNSSSGPIHRVHHQPSGFSGGQPMYHSANAAARGFSNHRSSFEPIASASHHHYRTYGSRNSRRSKVN